jgi:GNAT superfamily N-acetyltransferase
MLTTDYQDNIYNLEVMANYLFREQADFQNKGLGTTIMHEIEDRYSAVIKRYELSTGHKSDRNLHLYKKLGYKEMRRVPLNDNCNLIILAKSTDIRSK